MDYIFDLESLAGFRFLDFRWNTTMALLARAADQATRAADLDEARKEWMSFKRRLFKDTVPCKSATVVTSP